MMLDTSFPPDSRVENEAVSLIGAGHEVHLFSLDYDHTLKPREVINGIEVYRYYPSKLTYKLSALAYTFPFFRYQIAGMVRDFMENVNPDVIHIHDMILAETVMRSARLDQLPVVLDLHENRPVIMKEYAHLKKFPGNILIQPRRWEKAQARLIHQAGHVIVVTEEAREQIIRQYGKKPQRVVVVPNTIHPDIYLTYPIQEQIVNRFSGGFTLLYMGDTGLRRGTDTAIQAVALLKDKIKDIKLVLVGSNSEDIHLKNLVKEMALEKYIFFEGWQDVSLFPSYVEAADICLSPLKRNLHHDTTYANKIFQYMAMGKPLIVSDCPAQANVVLKTGAGLVHTADDAQDLADKIMLLHQDESRRENMGKHARESVLTTWNWNKTSAGLLQLYSSFPKHSDANVE